MLKLSDIQNAVYSASFMKPQAWVNIHGATYVKIGKNKWQHETTASHAIGGTISDKQLFDLISKYEGTDDIKINENRMKHLYNYGINEAEFRVEYVGKNSKGEEVITINGVKYGYKTDAGNAKKLQKMLQYSSGRALKWWKTVADHVSGGKKGSVSEGRMADTIKYCNMSMKSFLQMRDITSDPDHLPYYCAFKFNTDVTCPGTEITESEINRLKNDFWMSKLPKMGNIPVPKGAICDVIVDEFDDSIDDFRIGFVLANKGGRYTAYSIKGNSLEKSNVTVTCYYQK